MMSNSQHSGGADRESLSALFDGELQGDAARFALKRLGQDAQWREACGTWQLAGDVLRGQAMAAAPRDFAQRVQAALAHESATLPLAAGIAGAHVIAPRRRWIGGAALAASVAVAALFVVRPFDQPAPDAATSAPRIAASAGPSVEDPLASTAPASRAPVPAATERDFQPAAATVATIEAPRRASDRRSRGQNPRTALRASREPDVPVIMAVATPVSAAIASRSAIDRSPSDDATGVHPFQPPVEIASRPWPRAVLPDYPATGALTASYGNRAGNPDANSPSFYPFEPRLPQDIDAGSSAPQPRR